MKIMIRSVGLLFGLASWSAIAADYNDAWYISPMYTYTDQNRQSHNGKGGTLTLGKPVSDRFNIEFGAFFQNFGARDGIDRPAYDEYGGKFNVLWVLHRGALQPYFNGGIGWARNERKDSPFRKELDPTAEVGAGVIVPIADWGFGLRMEGMYRYVDYEHPANVPGGPDIDGVDEKYMNVGLYIPLAGGLASNEPAPAAAPVRQSPGYPDADGDGVPDMSDACMNTPPGATVDGAGCRLKAPALLPSDPEIEPDSDGDLLIDRLDPCPNHPSPDPFTDKSCM